MTRKKSKPIGYAPDGAPLFRDLKSKPAPRNHPIYRLGFAVGGKRLTGIKNDADKRRAKR